MLMVDTSVWIDFFNGKASEKVDILEKFLISDMICISDIIILEILQGIHHDNQYTEVRDLLTNLHIYEILNKSTALKSAENYRKLRKRGITIRKTIDVIIATFCIDNDITLLHNDRDYDSFAKYLNLKTV